MITCDICKRNLKSMNLYQLHMSYHRHLPRIRMICKYPLCGLSFNGYNKFKKHITESHKSKQEIERGIFLKRLVNCSLGGCSFKSTNKREICSHIYRHIRQG